MPVTCFICGRDFGTRSIAIHLPNCRKKWENEQEKLPKSQRRPLPEPPELFEKILSGEIKGKTLKKANQQAFDEFNESALVACQNCQSLFALSRSQLMVHLHFIHDVDIHPHHLHVHGTRPFAPAGCSPCSPLPHSYFG